MLRQCSVCSDARPGRGNRFWFRRAERSLLARAIFSISVVINNSYAKLSAMSKGHGRVQLALLRFLRLRRRKRRKTGVDAATLARLVFETNTPTASQLESTRRALRSLRREGLVDVNRQRAIYVMR